MHIEKNLENLNACQCLNCPSYTQSCKLKNKEDLEKRLDNLSAVTHFEKMFCAFEKSHCIHENFGCKCTQCAVHKKYALNNEDYCLHTGGVL
jgi:hypothetical protein